MSTWITGYFGHENLGDEAILAAVLSNAALRQNAKVLTWNAPSIKRIHNNIPCLKTPPVGKNQFKYAVKHGLSLLPDFISGGPAIIAGGGSLNDHVPNRIVNRLKEVEQLISLRRKVGLLGMGANQLVLEADKAALKTLIEERVTYCSVRDDESLNALINSGIDVSNVNKTTDLVFSLNNENTKKTHTVDALNEAKVALNFRPLFNNQAERGNQKNARYQHYVDECISIIEGLKGMVGHLDLLPLCPEDAEFLNMLSKQTNVPVVAPEINPYEAVKTMSGYDMLVGMRYHAVIFSLLAGLVTVPISYSPKVYSVNELFSLGGEDLVVGDGSEMPDTILTANDLFKVVEKNWTNKSAHLANNALLCQKQCDIAQQDIQNCWTTLKS